MFAAPGDEAGHIGYHAFRGFSRMVINDVLLDITNNQRYALRHANPLYVWFRLNKLP
jgi:hypothetical protein